MMQDLQPGDGLSYFQDIIRLPTGEGAIAPSPMAVSSTLTAPQVFTTLIIGLLMAFAFQLLLTNFGVALGISVLGFRNSTGTDGDQVADSSSTSSASTSSGSAMRTIGFLAGFGILVTINTVLFAACFLSVKLSVVADPILGAILGVVIWSAYLLIVLWVSSTAVGSLVGATLSWTTSGLRVVISTIRAAFQSPELPPPPALDTTVLQTLRQEIQTALSTLDVQSVVDDYLTTLQPSQLELQAMQQELQQALVASDQRSTALVETVLKQLGNSREEWDEVEIVSQDPLIILQHQLEEYLTSLDKPSLKSKAVQRTVTDWLDESQVDTETFIQGLHTVERDALIQHLEQNSALSPEAIEKRVKRLLELRDRLLVETQSQQDLLHSDLMERWEKLETYLRHTSPERLTPKGVKRKLQRLFQDVHLRRIPASIRNSSLPLVRLETVLQRRTSLAGDRVQPILSQIQETWEELITDLPLHQDTQDSVDHPSLLSEIRGQMQSLVQQIDWSALNWSEVQPWIMQLLRNPKLATVLLAAVNRVDWSVVSDRLRQSNLDDRQLQQGLEFLRSLNQDTFSTLLDARDTTQGIITHVTGQIEGVRDRLLNQIESLQQETQSRIDNLKQQTQQNIESTRKAAATAAWWLFGITLSSGVTSAIAGFLATTVSSGL